jgi:hypothetical protein
MKNERMPDEKRLNEGLCALINWMIIRCPGGCGEELLGDFLRLKVTEKWLLYYY